MATLSVLRFPDPRLKLVAKPTESFDAELASIATNLFETMYEFDGVGLAATQVNVLQRIFVIDLSDNRSQPMCFVNPTITASVGEITHEEGCLSFPGAYAKVKRKEQITVEYFDLEGQPHTLEAQGLLSICIQHELDHLDGVTFFDHLSSLKQKLIRSKLDKQRDKIS